MENQTTHHQDITTGSRRHHTRLVPEVEKEIEYKKRQCLMSKQVLDWQLKDDLSSENEAYKSLYYDFKRRQIVAHHSDNCRRDILQKLISIHDLEAKIRKRSKVGK